MSAAAVTMSSSSSSSQQASSGANCVTKAQLKKKYNFSSDCEVYRLLADGTAQLAETNGPLLSEEIFLEDKGFRKSSFPCSHAMLTDHWKAPADYDFVLAEGFDPVLYEDSVILIQRGMLRFGCKNGYSIRSLIEICKSWKSRYAPAVSGGLCLPDDASASPVLHKAVYGLPMLRALANGQMASKKICPSELPFSSIPPSELVELQTALASVRDLIDRAEHQSTRPFQCKNCKCLKDIKSEKLVVINALRAQGAAAALICPGCSSTIYLDGKACSNATCSPPSSNAPDFCLSGTKTCVYCVDGAAESSHSLSACTALMQQCLSKGTPLPPMRMCHC